MIVITDAALDRSHRSRGYFDLSLKEAINFGLNVSPLILPTVCSHPIASLSRAKTWRMAMFLCRSLRIELKHIATSPAIQQ